MEIFKKGWWGKMSLRSVVMERRWYNECQGELELTIFCVNSLRKLPAVSQFMPQKNRHRVGEGESWWGKAQTWWAGCSCHANCIGNSNRERRQHDSPTKIIRSAAALRKLVGGTFSRRCRCPPTIPTDSWPRPPPRWHSWSRPCAGAWDNRAWCRSPLGVGETWSPSGSGPEGDTSDPDCETPSFAN